MSDPTFVATIGGSFAAAVAVSVLWLTQLVFISDFRQRLKDDVGIWRAARAYPRYVHANLSYSVYTKWFLSVIAGAFALAAGLTVFAIGLLEVFA